MLVVEKQRSELKKWPRPPWRPIPSVASGCGDARRERRGRRRTVATPGRLFDIEISYINTGLYVRSIPATVPHCH